MATVTERGQLVLIGALSLAISLVAIALVLNSAIYTHNLASRYDSPGDSIAMANNDIGESVGEQIRYANDDGDANDLPYSEPSNPDVLGSYGNGVADIESRLASSAAQRGRIYRVTRVSETQGARIIDDESGGSTFVSRTSAVDWTVVADGRVRAFTIVARPSGTPSESPTDLVGNLLTSSTFAVGFDDDGDGTDEWLIAIYENDDTGASDISVTVHDVDANTYATCTDAGTVVPVSFAQGTVGDTSCSALSFVDDLPDTYDVRYVDSDQISGSYRLVTDGIVDGPGSEVGPFTDRVDAVNYAYHCGDSGSPKATFYGAASSNFPRVTPAIYAGDVNMVYDRDDVAYEVQTRVAPGETGQPAGTPRVESFTVSEPDTDTSDGEYTVSWTVTDPNGDSVSTTLDAVDDSGDTVTTTTSGTTLDLEDNDGPYTFRLTVSDGTYSRTVTQTHNDDGNDMGCLP